MFELRQRHPRPCRVVSLHCKKEAWGNILTGENRSSEYIAKHYVVSQTDPSKAEGGKSFSVGVTFRVQGEGVLRVVV